MHVGIIPRAGGVPILIGILVPFLLYLPLSLPYLAILISCILLVAVGLFDDRKDVHPYIRLVTNALAVLIVIAAGIRIPFVANPFQEGVIIPLEIVSLLLSFVWIYWTMNIVGWSAGVDGQFPGLVS